MRRDLIDQATESELRALEAAVLDLEARAEKAEATIERVQAFCRESRRWRRRLVDVEDVRRLVDPEEA